jgi:hypothetical protein
MAGSLGVMSVGPTAATKEVEEDVKGGHLGGCCRGGGPAMASTEIEDVDGEPLGGAVSGSDNGHHQS